MSTSGTTALNHISTILLALKRMRRPGLEKVLHHLRDPTPSDDYGYLLDALSTLCSFAGPCQSGSAAVQHFDKSNHLFLATSLPAPSILRDQLTAWINLIQDLPVHPSSSEDDNFESFDRDYTRSEESFIVDVYRACHAKLLDVINRDDIGQNLLDSVINMTERILKMPRPQFVTCMELLVGMGKSKTFSADDLLSLHRTARAVAPSMRSISSSRTQYTALSESVYRLTHAIDVIIMFATCGHHKARIQLPWHVVWVDVPSAAPQFLATTNPQALAKIVGKKVYDKLASNELATFEPTASGLAGTVEVSPGHFTGSGVVHCASALLLYILSNRLRNDVVQYIGCSHSICYGCLMLVQAYNDAFETDFEVGRRDINLEELDIAWAYPKGMGQVAYKGLLEGLIRDLRELATQPYPGAVRPIMTDPSGLPAHLRD
ncbi:hypothetical protein V8D89_008608 [Ganoderma adspersum]